MYSLMRIGFVVLLAVALSTGCEEATSSKSFPDHVSDISPWEIPLEMGNFAIDGNEIALWESLESLNRINDCVLTSRLPSGNFQTFRLRIFVPQHSNILLYDIILKDIKAHVSYLNNRTNDIFHSGSHIDIVELDFGSAPWYSEFEVMAQYSGEEITRTTFMNIVFSFELEYVSGDSGATVSAREVSVEVFQSHTSRCAAGG